MSSKEMKQPALGQLRYMLFDISIFMFKSEIYFTDCNRMCYDL